MLKVNNEQAGKEKVVYIISNTFKGRVRLSIMSSTTQELTSLIGIPA
jgi:hypothetical protein